ncbi:MAG: hypothetical protein RR346_01085 [Bacteroidales bacterium]
MKVKLIYLFFLVSCIACNKDLPKITEARQLLNYEDSINMLPILKQMKIPLENWNLEDINQWYGATFEYDTEKDEYRIVGICIYDFFYGEIPKEICNFPYLKELILVGSNISGKIPQNISSLKNLEVIILSGKWITGEIPKEIGDLKNLKRLELSNTGLYGSLPEEIGNLENLEWLEICNTELSGTIPESLNKLNKLDRCIMDKNHFSGKFPISILNDRKHFLFGDNNIEELPWEVWLDDNKNIIPDLQGNRLSGKIPAEVLSSKKWKEWGVFVGRQQTGFGYEE